MTQPEQSKPVKVRGALTWPEVALALGALLIGSVTILTAVWLIVR